MMDNKTIFLLFKKKIYRNRTIFPLFFSILKYLMYVCEDNVSALLFSVKPKCLPEATWNMRLTYSSLSLLIATYIFLTSEIIAFISFFMLLMFLLPFLQLCRWVLVKYQSRQSLVFRNIQIPPISSSTEGHFIWE